MTEQTLQERMLETYNWLCATRGVKKASVKLTQDELLDILCALNYVKATKFVEKLVDEA